MSNLPPLADPSRRVALVGPGLVKAQARGSDPACDRLGVAVVAERRPTLWSIRETWIARLFEEADTFSEGECVTEPADPRRSDGHERRVYYGSTSLRCPVVAVRARIEGLPAGEVIAPTELARVLLANPHARLCAVRIARREACARAGASLAVLHAELGARVLVEAGSVRLAIDVDVSAELARLHERVLSE